MTPTNPAKEEAALLARVDALTEIERYADAVPLIQHGLSQDPENARLLYRMAFASHKMRDQAQALIYANRAVAADPTGEYGHRLCSTILLEEGRTSEAVHSAEEAVKCNPRGTQSLHTLVKVLLKAKNIDRAAEVASHLRSISPDSLWSYDASVLTAMHLLQWEKAEMHCRASLTIEPDMYSTHHNLGLVLCHLGRYREAVACYREALRLKPTEMMIRHRMTLAVLLSSLESVFGLVGLRLVMEGAGFNSMKIRRKHSTRDVQTL